MVSLGQKDWAGTRCQVYIADDPPKNGYAGGLTVKSMRAVDAEPGGVMPMNASELKASGSRLDAKLRAIAPTLGAKKAGTPSAPSAPNPQPKATENMDAEPADDLPHV